MPKFALCDIAYSGNCEAVICNVNLQKLLSAQKSQVMETSLFTGAISNQVYNSQAFVSVPGHNQGRSRRQHGAMVAISDDGGHVVVQDSNRDRISEEFVLLL